MSHVEVKPSADIKHAYLTTSLAATDYFYLYIINCTSKKKRGNSLLVLFCC